MEEINEDLLLKKLYSIYKPEMKIMSILGNIGVIKKGDNYIYRTDYMQYCTCTDTGERILYDKGTYAKITNRGIQNNKLIKYFIF